MPLQFVIMHLYNVLETKRERERKKKEEKKKRKEENVFLSVTVPLFFLQIFI